MADQCCEDKKTKISRGVVITLVLESSSEWLQNIEKVLGPDSKPFFMLEKDGVIKHAAIFVQGRQLFVEDEGSPNNLRQLKKKGGEGMRMRSRLNLTVDDALALEKVALENGATALLKVEQQHWGGMYGVFSDPNGVEWSLAQPCGHPEYYDIAAEEKRNLIPEIAVRDPDGEIEWVKKVFGAKLESDVARKDDKVLHSELAINGGLVFINSLHPPGDGVISISVEVPKGTAADHVQRFEKNGGKVLMPAELQCFGKVYGRACDFVGMQWGFCERA